MRIHLWVMSLLVSLVACQLLDEVQPDAGGSVDSGEIARADGGTNPPIGQCLPAQPLASAEAINTRARTQGWTSYGLYSSGATPVSVDLQVQGTLTLRGSDVVLPERCKSRSDCRQSVGFLARSHLPGVTLSDPTSQGDFQAVTLTDTTVRFRTVLIDRHPSRYNFIPVVELIEACAAPCESGELKCGRNQVCYSSSEYCRACLGNSAKACACWTPNGSVSEGKHCEWATSGDAWCGGTCQAGTCRPFQSVPYCQ